MNKDERNLLSVLGCFIWHLIFWLFMLSLYSTDFKLNTLILIPLAPFIAGLIENFMLSMFAVGKDKSPHFSILFWVFDIKRDDKERKYLPVLGYIVWHIIFWFLIGCAFIEGFDYYMPFLLIPLAPFVAGYTENLFLTCFGIMKKMMPSFSILNWIFNIKTDEKGKIIS